MVVTHTSYHQNHFRAFVVVVVWRLDVVRYKAMGSIKAGFTSVVHIYGVAIFSNGRTITTINIRRMIARGNDLDLMRASFSLVHWAFERRISFKALSEIAGF
jgi:hypothetical protein